MEAILAREPACTGRCFSLDSMSGFHEAYGESNQMDIGTRVATLEGLGTIEDRIDRDGHPYLVVRTDRLQLHVPEAQLALHGVRPLMSREDAEHLLAALKSGGAIRQSCSVQSPS